MLYATVHKVGTEDKRTYMHKPFFLYTGCTA